MSEQCEVCGCLYDYWWSAPNNLWTRVTGHDGDGLLCIPCFWQAALDKGIVIQIEAFEYIEEQGVDSAKVG